jgi:hypothetical protein
MGNLLKFAKSEGQEEDEVILGKEALRKESTSR